tara:strand:+ start:1457 stop:2113 length:657 start_codon:yes stop_codon:yes gene_type:complete
MAYKSAYTPEEAALIGAGIYEYFDGRKRINEYHTLEEAKCYVDAIEEEFRIVRSEDIINDYGSRERFEQCQENAYEFVARYQNATDIFDGINRAIAIGQIQAHTSNELQLIDQKSVAAWFMDQGDVETAQHFYPNILTVWRPETVQSLKNTPENDISTKSKNAYLRTISALSMALISGSSGKPHTDAEAALTAIDSAKIERPVSTRQLTKYLKEAGDY